MSHQRYSPDHDACGVGFVTGSAARPSHEIVERALTALLRLAHRGGVDADGRSGDGAGLLMAIPDAFMRKRACEEGIRLPGEFGLGMVFLPSGQERAAQQGIEDSRGKMACVARAGDKCRPTRRLPARGLVPLCPPSVSASSMWRGEASSRKSLFRLRKQVEAEAPARHLLLLPFLADRRLQGSVDARPVAGILSGSGAIRNLRRRLQSSTSATRPTRSRAGRWRNLSASSPITVKSTPSAPTAAGCTPKNAA